MTAAALSTRWLVEAEVLSPLHVGSGGPPLLAGYDFVAGRGQVWVLNVDRALDALPDDRIGAAMDGPVGPLVPAGDLAAVSRYRLALRDSAVPAQIIPCVRDVSDRPYLPGSSIKGALRTVAAAVLLSRVRDAFQLDRLGRGAQQAGRSMEQDLFGRDPNHDLMRAFRVSDFFIAGNGEAELSAVALYTLRPQGLEVKGAGYRWYVETLPVGTRLRGSVSLDEHALGPGGPGLEGRRPLLNSLPMHSRTFGATLTERERAFYTAGRLPRLADFSEGLAATIKSMGPREGVVQMAWGTGWTAKTMALVLSAEQRGEVVRRYRLDRDRRASAFPKTRRLVERGGVPEMPLGWLRWRIEDEG